MLERQINPIQGERSIISVARVSSAYELRHASCHDDLELNLITSGTGYRIVGDNVVVFQKDDLVLLGSNLLHTWRSFDENDRIGDQGFEAIVVRFPKKIFGGGDDYPEFHDLAKLMQTANSGIAIVGSGKERVIASLIKMVEYDGLERMIIFLGVMNAILRTCEHHTLSSDQFVINPMKKQSLRLENTYGHIVHHLQDKISLENLANKAQMNPSAFSRFFSKHFGTSITSFIQELRLSFACELLRATSVPVARIIELSGFHNQAYFNKLFLDRIKKSPYQYRKSQRS